MPAKTRQLLILVALAVLLVATAARAVRQWWPGAEVGEAAGAATRAGAAIALPAIDAVRLEALEASRPALAEGSRNPFRFRPPTAPPRPTPPPPIAPPGGEAGSAAGPGRGGLPAGAGAPPIALKFIGIVDAPTQGGKVAVLSDGRSVFQGHEGDAIDGRFQIVRIGVESVEMSYLDGRGRQTIRLTGQ